MSSLIVLSDKKDIFLMSDKSAIDPNGNRVDLDVQKLFVVNNKIIFCSGLLDIVRSVLSTELSEESIEECVKKFDTPNIEIFILDGNMQSHLSGETDYIFSHENLIPKDVGGVYSVVMGIETEKVSNCLFSSVSEIGFDEIKNNPSFFSERFFNSINDDKIGGSGDFVLFDRKNSVIKNTNLKQWKNTPANIQNRRLNAVSLVVGDALVGRILAGKTLSIENDGNNFTLNEQGAFLNNASFEITTDGGKNKLTLDPTDGIRLQKNEGGTFVDKFYLDSAGNAIFSGQLEAASGSFEGSITANSGEIGGWAIGADGISDTSGNYIRSDGNVRLGGLTITPTTATFDGDISANKLNGTIQWEQIENTPILTSQFNGGSGYSAGGITTGSLSGDRVYGGTISGPGGFILAANPYTGGRPYMYADALQITGGSYLVLDGNSTLSLIGSSSSITANNYLTVSTPNLYINGYTGQTKYIYYKDSSSNTQWMRFQNGILVTTST